MHKKYLFISIIVMVIIIGIFTYRLIVNNHNQVKYILTKVTRGNIQISVSGSGKIVASEQLSLTPKASGTLVYLGVTNGQYVTKGTLIAKLDTTDAQRVVRNAQIDLANAKLNLEQAQQSLPSDETSLKRQAIAAMATALNNTKNINLSFQDIFFTDISNYHINIQYLIDYYSNIVRFYFPRDVDYGNILTTNFNLLKQENIVNQTLFSYLSDNSSLNEVENTLNKIIEMTKLLNDSVHLGYQLLNRYQSVLNDNNLTPSINIRNIDSDKNIIANYTTLVDSNILTLLNIQKSFTSYHSGDNNMPVNIESLKLLVEQKQNALLDAQNSLSDYYVYAPFDGEISQLSVNKGDNISMGMPIAVLITKEKIAEITLTEMDLTKVKLGDEAQLTFDALPDFQTTGKVIEIDPMGIESQGVVSYTIKISLDQTDSRLKPGMSVNANIITTTKNNVLIVNNSAIKSLNNRKYVEIVALDKITPDAFKNGVVLTKPPARQFVEVGLSDENNSEIIGGLQEGDLVVLRTISNNSINNNTSRTMFNANFNPQTQRMFH